MSFRVLRRSGENRLARRTFGIIGAAATALFVVLGAGGAYAYFMSSGSGIGHATAGSSLTVTVTATSGTADLLPGGTGAAYFTLTNPNSLGASFNQVATGATVVSNNPGACPSSNVSIVPALPHTFSPAVTVGAKTTSTSQSIANFLALANTAPSACQNVTFTVTLTLEGTLS